MEEGVFWMQAKVCSVQEGQMEVCTLEGQRVLVWFPRAGEIFPGDVVSIAYDGRMTRSIPPQINALQVER